MSSSASSNNSSMLNRFVGVESPKKDAFASLEDGIVGLSSPAPSNNTDEVIEQQMPTSSSSIRNSFKHDVFLSFRGEDIRKTRVYIPHGVIRTKTFVGDLNEALSTKGIVIYNDYAKICNGETISDNLIKAIEESKFYIIVFSKNYASSPLCLEELVKIMECCHKMPGHTAYAVFYDVERTQVRDQTGPVGFALSKHENQEAVGKWKGALKEAADLDGWELELNTLEDQDKFIKKIVQKISLELHYGFDANLKDVVTPATYFFQFIAMLSPVLNKLVQAIDLTPSSAFSFIITCLLTFAALKSQSVTGFPFKTHPNAIKVPVTSVLIYAFASAAERVFSVAGLDHTSVYAIIARLGRISSLCLLVTSLAILIWI